MADRLDRPNTEAERGQARNRRARRHALLLVLGFGVADTAVLALLNGLGGQQSILVAAVVPVLLLQASAVVLRPALRTRGWLPSRAKELAPAQRVVLPAYLRSNGENDSAPAAYARGRLVFELGATEPLIWQRHRFLYGFDAETRIPLCPPYRVLNAGPMTGARAVSVDPLVYRQLDVQANELNLAVAVPEEALRFVRASLVTVERAYGATKGSSG